MKPVMENHINVSDIIMHPAWGIGVVTKTLGSGHKKILQVLFENSFYKIFWESAVSRHCEVLRLASMEG